ncbi:cobalt/nickel transport system permease protein [Oikeobacillus pervagus]|uniref:Cobalt/nickel transport system permease protein n=1 Tax=Oikeobacillus pervagus TaxID=1325931 RepID=A0AAJ1SWP3_9BACI|nr:cobalt ECF transporter T component CbiQ [Oikeobacillus pervagus]MDQ0214238.1 cobalt/nickel transport system permease protein [Oikeobacillus pervagus]
MIIDTIANQQRLSTIHPIEKFIFAIGCLLTTVTLRDVGLSLLIFFIMSMIIIIVMDIHILLYLKLLSLPLLFILTSIISILFTFSLEPYSGEDLIWSGEIGPIFIFILFTNFEVAIELFLISIGSVTCIYFFILSTPVHELLFVLSRLRLPKELIDLISITYRFLFMLMETAIQMYYAQSTRLGHRSFRISLRSFSILIPNLFIQTLKKRTEMQQAIDSRGADELILSFTYEGKVNKKHLFFLFFFFIILFSGKVFFE